MVMFFNKIRYGLYMFGTLFKGAKYSCIKRTKGIENGEQYLSRIFNEWAQYTINILGIEVQVEGLERIPKSRCVFIGNHTSILDIPLVFYASGRMMGFITKEEAMKIPIISYWLKRGRCVPLNRSSAREAVKTISQGVENLNEGYSMAIFPEGKRSRNGEVLEFKRGSMKLATKAKAPIVPVAIDGAYKCYEKDKKFKKGTIKVSFGEPIFTKTLTRVEEKELPDKVRNEIIDMLDKKVVNI